MRDLSPGHLGCAHIAGDCGHAFGGAGAVAEAEAVELLAAELAAAMLAAEPEPGGGIGIGARRWCCWRWRRRGWWRQEYRAKRQPLGLGARRGGSRIQGPKFCTPLLVLTFPGPEIIPRGWWVVKSYLASSIVLST